LSGPSANLKVVSNVLSLVDLEEVVIPV